jgi:hypothetical protein
VKFAKVVFTVAGVWGLLVLIPMYFLRDRIGEQYPPPIAHADFYYGFLAVTLVWQIAFLIIARDPARFRPMMVPAILEKFVYIASMLVLFGLGELQAGQVAVTAPDFVLGVLFVAAFAKTRGFFPTRAS